MKLALGSVQFGDPYGISNEGGRVSQSELTSILRCAHSNGINTIDTAIAYGESESRLGKVGVRDWNVVTKLPPVPEGSRDVFQWVRDSVDRSLMRLNVSHLYGLLLHCPRQLLEPIGADLFDSLLRIKEQNLARKIGASIYDPSELDELGGRFKFDLIQAPLNLIDRRIVDSEWMARLSGQGIELHARSAFLQGLLLMAPDIRPEKFGRWSRIWERYDKWLQESGLTALQACVRYTLSFPEISKVVVGVQSRSQLEDVLGSADGPVPAVPDAFSATDSDLINPAHWLELT